MIDRFTKDHTMPCITAVTPTICKMMGVSAPAIAAPDYIKIIIRAAESKGVDKIDKCLVYAPDAIGLQMYQNAPLLFDAILKHAPIAVPLTSVIPSITPVCYASMFTGARPEIHGAHIDTQSGKGAHGDDIPQDMHVQHYIGIQQGQSIVAHS